MAYVAKITTIYLPDFFIDDEKFCLFTSLFCTVFGVHHLTQKVYCLDAHFLSYFGRQTARTLLYCFESINVTVCNSQYIFSRPFCKDVAFIGITVKYTQGQNLSHIFTLEAITKMK